MPWYIKVNVTGDNLLKGGGNLFSVIYFHRKDRNRSWKMSDSDDCDWFDKDEDDLMKDLQKTIKAKQMERMEEHVTFSSNKLGNI